MIIHFINCHHHDTQTQSSCITDAFWWEVAWGVLRYLGLKLTVQKALLNKQKNIAHCVISDVLSIVLLIFVKNT